MLDPRRGMFEGTWKDIRCATRSLRRTPGFTATAIVMLALGIGANTAIFTLVNALVLRTLPLPDPGSLVFVGSRNAAAADSGVNLLSNPAWLQRIRRETAVFAGVAAYNVRDFKVASAGAVEQVVGQYATGNYHALLGVPMALGRGFANENDFAAGSTPIAVISDNYWSSAPPLSRWCISRSDRCGFRPTMSSAPFARPMGLRLWPRASGASSVS